MLSNIHSEYTSTNIYAIVISIECAHRFDLSDSKHKHFINWNNNFAIKLIDYRFNNNSINILKTYN